MPLLYRIATKASTSTLAPPEEEFFAPKTLTSTVWLPEEPHALRNTTVRAWALEEYRSMVAALAPSTYTSALPLADAL